MALGDSQPPIPPLRSSTGPCRGALSRLPGRRDLTVTPATGTLTVPAASSATASVTVTAAATEGSYSVSFATTLSSGTALPATAVSADVAKPGELWPYYTSIGVSSDGQVTSSGYNGDSWLYSANALAAAGVTPGGTITADGIPYTVSSPSAAPDPGRPAPDSLPGTGPPE